MGSVCEILIAERTKNAGKAKCKMFNYCHNVFLRAVTILVGWNIH